MFSDLASLVEVLSEGMKSLSFSFRLFSSALSCSYSQRWITIDNFIL